MTPDTSKRYLLHSVYGDAAGLIATAPADVICVPCGPDAESEAARAELIGAMGCGGPSCLPALFVYVPEIIDEAPGYWHEVRVAELPKPWTWEAMP